MTKVKSSIDKAAQDAVKVISDAAKTATTAIATAALDATKLLASNAAEAVKLTEKKDGTDHDLLQRLDEKVDGLKIDIKEIKDGTSAKISDHEVRINALETSNTRQTVMLSIGVGILGLLVSLLVWHLVGR